MPIPAVALPAAPAAAPAPAAPAPAAPPAVPSALAAQAQPNPDVRPTSANSDLPKPAVLTVIGGLIAMTLAAAGSGAVSFQSASAAQARIDAARAEFFGPRA
ncbi:hypothetical protein [Nocardia jiangxiensis]|uniref:hypothetical protein n=1 Tax=Nocardia jiangxiensis TaxID=282685 RepID=UPI00159C0479|nr:hypothetical protein [Nocardia jiangxiensis]